MLESVFASLLASVIWYGIKPEDKHIQELQEQINIIQEKVIDTNEGITWLVEDKEEKK
tara:strand:+ start:2439 stop:2612 length:174 start_codon:yes stop_codon:yes gene_type:complete